MTTDTTRIDSLQRAESGVAAEGAAGFEPPLTFSRAMRRNAFFRDEEGQAMVEMAIIGPFLMFALVTVMYFWGMCDQQQDYYIRASNDYWAVVARQDKSPSAAGRTVARSDDEFGIGRLASLLGIGGPLAFLDIQTIMGPLGLGTTGLFLEGDSGDFTSNPIQSLLALTGVTGLTGPSYERMGFNPNDYDVTDPEPYGYDNPWRNSLMGMCSFFAASRGGEQEDPVETIFPEQLNMYANFRMINGSTWHCSPLRASSDGEWTDFIGARASPLTTMDIPVWGLVIRGLITGAGGPFFIGELAPYSLANPVVKFLPPILNPSGSHNPYAFKVDTGGSFWATAPYETFQTDKILGMFATGPGNVCADFSGDINDFWR
jgi:Flp pilus assembly pilin Flp